MVLTIELHGDEQYLHDRIITYVNEDDENSIGELEKFTHKRFDDSPIHEFHQSAYHYKNTTIRVTDERLGNTSMAVRIKIYASIENILKSVADELKEKFPQLEPYEHKGSGCNRNI